MEDTLLLSGPAVASVTLGALCSAAWSAVTLCPYSCLPLSAPQPLYPWGRRHFAPLWVCQEPESRLKEIL